MLQNLKFNIEYTKTKVQDVQKFAQVCVDFIIQIMQRNDQMFLITSPLPARELILLDDLKPALELIVSCSTFQNHVYRVAPHALMLMVLGRDSDELAERLRPMIMGFKAVSGY